MIESLGPITLRYPSLITLAGWGEGEGVRPDPGATRPLPMWKSWAAAATAKIDDFDARIELLHGTTDRERQLTLTVGAKDMTRSGRSRIRAGLSLCRSPPRPP